jgi:ABC-type multidrug transport system ATPase subunit
VNQSQQASTRLSIAMSNVSVSLPILKESNPSPNIFSPVANGIKHIGGCIRGEEVNQQFYRLKNVDAYHESGSMTLILAPPGMGKSSYLKTVAQSLQIDKKPTPQPNNDNSQHYGVLYNGATPEAARAANIDMKKMIQYVEQTDLGMFEFN